MSEEKVSTCTCGAHKMAPIYHRLDCPNGPSAVNADPHKPTICSKDENLCPCPNHGYGFAVYARSDRDWCPCCAEYSCIDTKCSKCGSSNGYATKNTEPHRAFIRGVPPDEVAELDRQADEAHAPLEAARVKATAPDSHLCTQCGKPKNDVHHTYDSGHSWHSGAEFHPFATKYLRDLLNDNANATAPDSAMLAAIQVEMIFDRDFHKSIRIKTLEDIANIIREVGNREFCEGCDHGVVAGKVCELCGGTGYKERRRKVEGERERELSGMLQMFISQVHLATLNDNDKLMFENSVREAKRLMEPK